MKPTIQILFAVGVVTLVTSLSSCQKAPEGSFKAEIEQLHAKGADTQKAVMDLSMQVRTLNEENNRLKSLVSQLTDGMIAQKESLQKISAAPPAPVAAPKAIAPAPRPAPRPASRVAPKNTRTSSRTVKRPAPKPTSRSFRAKTPTRSSTTKQQKR